MYLYWSMDPFLGNAGIRGVMTENRFAKLYQFLHLNDNQTAAPRGDENYDKLHKVRPLFDMTAYTFKSRYNPKMNQTIDEAIVKYKGRFSIKQYMPGKPIKRGMKVWMRCDSSSGYCHQFDIYMGKDDRNRGPQLDQKVVKTSVQGPKVEGTPCLYGQILYFYSSGENVQEKGNYSCGTIKVTSPGLPGLIKSPPRLSRGESVSLQHDNLVATVWQGPPDFH